MNLRQRLVRHALKPLTQLRRLARTFLQNRQLALNDVQGVDISVIENVHPTKPGTVTVPHPKKDLGRDWYRHF